MARYFFDTDDGTTRFQDQDGTECADADSARALAARALAELAAETISADSSQGTVTMWVRRGQDAPILQLALNFGIRQLA